MNDPNGPVPDERDEPTEDEAPDGMLEPTLFEAVSGLARIGVRAGVRTAEWLAKESVNTGRAVVDPGQSLAPYPPRTSQSASAEELRARGAELLRRSSDVRDDEDTHPAFARILDDLTPDEARILRFLQVEGPQPSVDVRTGRPFGVGSELVAAGLSMIGLQAGVRHLDRTRSYLNNLERLGLVWFSRETVEPSRYQVVEVQPEVVDAMKQAGRAPTTVRRSVHLTPFGDDFCASCLPLDR